jgi:hypothetical protein
MLKRLLGADDETRIQYLLMGLSGVVWMTLAVLPSATVSDDIRIPLITLFIGLMCGLWLSHLISLLTRSVKTVVEQ